MGFSTSERMDQYRLCKENTKQMLAESAWMKKEYLITKLRDTIEA